MFRSQYFKTLSRLCILFILITCLWLFSTKADQNFQQFESQITVTSKQLPMENGVYPVEIRCEAAPLVTPNKLEGFSCKLKNNKNKNVIAVNLIYSIVLDRNGMAERDKHTLIIETLVDPDFRDTNQPIAGGAEQVIGPFGKISYENSVIKGVEVEVDYIEFEDGTTSGSNESGSKNIADMRGGVRKYKNWLIQQYKKQGMSVSTLEGLLNNDQPLPNASGELEFKNSYEENGARAYRIRLRKIRDLQGSEGLEKHFKKILNLGQ